MNAVLLASCLPFLFLITVALHSLFSLPPLLLKWAFISGDDLECAHIWELFPF